MREEVELLEDHAEVAAHLVDVVGLVVDVLPVDDDAAAVDLFKTVDGAQQGGLAGAGRPDDDHALAGSDIEAHILQGRELSEVLPDVADADDGLGAIFFCHSD